jgi:hypothetical protein
MPFGLNHLANFHFSHTPPPPDHHQGSDWSARCHHRDPVIVAAAVLGLLHHRRRRPHVETSLTQLSRPLHHHRRWSSIKDLHVLVPRTSSAPSSTSRPLYHLRWPPASVIPFSLSSCLPNVLMLNHVNRRRLLTNSQINLDKFTDWPWHMTNSHIYTIISGEVLSTDLFSKQFFDCVVHRFLFYFQVSLYLNRISSNFRLFFRRAAAVTTWEFQL